VEVVRVGRVKSDAELMKVILVTALIFAVKKAMKVVWIFGLF